MMLWNPNEGCPQALVSSVSTSVGSTASSEFKLAHGAWKLSGDMIFSSGLKLIKSCSECHVSKVLQCFHTAGATGAIFLIDLAARQAPSAFETSISMIP